MVWRALLLKGELWLSIFAFHRPRWYWVEDLRTWMICRETEFIHRCCPGRTGRVPFLLSSLLFSLSYILFTYAYWVGTNEKSVMPLFPVCTHLMKDLTGTEYRFHKIVSFKCVSFTQTRDLESERHQSHISKPTRREADKQMPLL